MWKMYNRSQQTSQRRKSELDLSVCVDLFSVNWQQEAAVSQEDIQRCNTDRKQLSLPIKTKQCTFKATTKDIKTDNAEWLCKP